MVGESGIKLYVALYFAVPPATTLGTFMERLSVEFSPRTGGSGENFMDDSLNSEAPFEQSVTEASTKYAANIRSIFIYMYISIRF